jgi:multiple sugar transport system substrate-binding protein
MRQVNRTPSTESRPFTRRASLGLGATAAGAVVLAACDPPGTSGAPAARRAGATLEFWGGPSAAARQDQVARWNEANPRVQVRFRTVPGVGQGAEALRMLVAAVAAHTTPHLLDFDRFQVPACANWRVFRTLDDLLKRDRYDLARLAPVAVEEATGLDGRLYGLPSSVDNRLLFWNKTRFADAGLHPDAPPSWDALGEIAPRLAAGDGTGNLDRFGLDPGGGQATLHLFAWQNGGGFQSADGKSATLPLAPNVAALQWMIELVHAQGGWAALHRRRERWSREDGAGHPFLTGELAMQYQLPNWAGDTVARYRPTMDFGVAAPPPRRAGGPALTWSGGYSYVMSRDTTDVDASWELLRWLVDEPAWLTAFDGERARAQAVGGIYLPGMTGQPALDARLLERYRTGHPALDAVPEVALRLMVQSRVRERSIAAADLWDGVIRAQSEAFFGEDAPQPALERHNVLAQRALDQAWIFGPR